MDTEARIEREAMIDSLQVGDLVRFRGALRVVRGVNRFAGYRKSKRKPSQVQSIDFSILRCSWTRRPYTVVSRCDLYRVPLEIVKRGFGTEHGPLDVLLQRDIDARGCAPSLLQCCDVIGVTF
ncbi:MAG TPA: hypothetical protein VFH85_07620 [Gammaproteobacteria bacterium]|nr:hypothetical protein [Gammaproteobacteria bacterium]